MARRIRKRSFDEEVRSLEKLLGQDDLVDDYMNEDVDEILTQDEVEDEVLDADDDVTFIDEDEVFEEEPDILTEDEFVEDEDLDLMYSSEDKPGVEDEITQDYLNEVKEEAGDETEEDEEKESQDETEDEEKESQDEEDVVVGSSVKEAKISKFREASRRLDRVADYFEKSGRKDLALRIDRLSTSLDSETRKLASVRK